MALSPPTRPSWPRSDTLVHKNGRPKSKLRNWTFRSIAVLFFALILGFLGWSCWVYVQIENYAGLDPVFRARLDHARKLYDRGIAPLIITLGGANKDEYSEGAVGRDYLMSLGIPESAIIAETESRNTEEQAHRIAVIAHANNLRRLVVVSDGTHLFRIHEICAADGLDVLTSPRGSRAYCARDPQLHRLAASPGDCFCTEAELAHSVCSCVSKEPPGAHSSGHLVERVGSHELSRQYTPTRR